MKIGEIIASQLGGTRRLNAMTGAYNFLLLEDGLSFRLKNPSANYVKIELNGKDLYDVEIGRVRGGSYKIVHEYNDIYNDQLKEVIEMGTGMYLSLEEGGAFGAGHFAEGGNMEGKNGYIAFYNEKQMEVYADTSLEARDKAAKMFKAKKPYMVTVVLAEKGGKQVTHNPSFAEGGAFGAGHFAKGGYIEVTNPEKELFSKGFFMHGGDAWETFEDAKNTFDSLNLNKENAFIVKVNTNKMPYYAIAEKKSMSYGGTTGKVTHYLVEIETDENDEIKVYNLEFKSRGEAGKVFRKYAKSMKYNNQEIVSVYLIKVTDTGDTEPINMHYANGGAFGAGHFAEGGDIDGFTMQVIRGGGDMGQTEVRTEERKISFEDGGAFGAGHFAKGGKFNRLKRDEKFYDLLFEADGDAWDSIGANSGSQIRADKKMLAEYAKEVNKNITALGIEKGSLTDADFDYAENWNHHLLNEFLAWNGYYNPKKSEALTKDYEEGFSEYPNSYSDPKAITLVKYDKKYGKYIPIKNIKTVTIKKGGKELTYKGEDTFDGAYVLEDGGGLKGKAFYTKKADVVKVTLNDGSEVNPINGFWIKKTAEPLEPVKSKMPKSMDIKFLPITVKVYDLAKKEGITYEKLGNEELEQQLLQALVSGLTDANFHSEAKEMVAKLEGEPWSDKLYKSVYFNPSKKVGDFGRSVAKLCDYDGIAILNAFYYISKMEGNKAASFIEKFTSNLKFENGGAFGAGNFSIFSCKRNMIIADGYETEEDAKKEMYNMFETTSDFSLQIIKNKKSNFANGGAFGAGHFADGGKVTFDEKSAAIARSFAGKKVEPKYQSEYGKTYSKEEASEVGDKIAGAQKAKYDSKPKPIAKKKASGGMVIGNPKMKQANDLAKQIRKSGEKWHEALKRAHAQLKG